MASKPITATILSIFITGILVAAAGTTPAEAASPRERPARAPQASANPAQSICVAQLFCSQVVAQVGNPPAAAAWYGITQASMSYPGYTFGPIFLAHLGTPEGWAFYDVKLGDTISVQWTDQTVKNYRVISIRRYKLAGKDWMVDLDNGHWYKNMQVYAMNQSDPYLSLETCMKDPKAVEINQPQSADLGNWGRMFIKAEPLP